MKQITYFTMQKIFGVIGLALTILAMLSGAATFTEMFVSFIIIGMCVALIFSKELYEHFEDEETYYEDEEDH